MEKGLIDHIQRFLLELGEGFAFVGRQVHLEFATKDYYLDLLFYHLKLRSYVVVELKSISSRSNTPCVESKSRWVLQAGRQSL